MEKHAQETMEEGEKEEERNEKERTECGGKNETRKG